MLPTLRLAVCRPAGVAFISLPGISLGGIAAAGAVPGEAMLGGTSGADAWASEASAGSRLTGAVPASGMAGVRSEEHTSELQSLMRISYAVFCLKKKKKTTYVKHNRQHNT